MENQMAEHYTTGRLENDFDTMAEHSRSRSSRCTDEFGKAVGKELLELGSFTIPTLSLNSLRLYGLDLEVLARSPIGACIDFTILTSLNLGSCFGLDESLLRLTASIGARPGASLVPRLKSFYLRHERSDTLFGMRLGAFLCSFAGLWHLHVLLEGSAPRQTLSPILAIHGKTLRTLVWDQRTGQRVAPCTSVSKYADHSEHLRIISQKCPKLIGLGISLDWNQIYSKEYRDKVRHYTISHCSVP